MFKECNIHLGKSWQQWPA